MKLHELRQIRQENTHLETIGQVAQYKKQGNNFCTICGNKYLAKTAYSTCCSNNCYETLYRIEENEVK